MDSNDLEKERGITILAKNTAISWREWRINIVDTPGHADFGGEVERVLSMVDGVLLLVDAVDGPMPQTRFVTQQGVPARLHAARRDQQGRPRGRARGLGARSDVRSVRSPRRERQAARLPGDLRVGAQGLRVARSRRARRATCSRCSKRSSSNVPPPPVEMEGPLQLQVSSLDYSSYVGLLGIGRVSRGVVKRNMPVTARAARRRRAQRPDHGAVRIRGARAQVDHRGRRGRHRRVQRHRGSARSPTRSARAAKAEGLPPLQVDEPTITMTFQVNKSPFAGKEGKYLTSRQIRARLEQELLAQRRAARRGHGRRGQVSRLGPRRAASVGADREHAPRRLRARGVAAGGDRAVGRRRRAGAVGAAHGGLRGAVPGRRDDAARRAQGRADLDDARRPRPRAARVSDSRARPDRLPHRVPHRDGGHRPALPHLRRLRAARERARSASASTARSCRWCKARRSATRCSTCRSAARCSSATASRSTKA